MKALAARAILTIACSVAAVWAGPVAAQSCGDGPSSDCPAVPRGAPSYPCGANQVKGDWDSMLYHLPTQVSYATVGSGYYSDIACFDTAQEAASYGFRRAFR